MDSLDSAPGALGTLVAYMKAEADAADLPLELPLVLNALTPAIMATFGWDAVPAVALQGLFVFDSEALAEAARAGLPVAHSGDPKELDLLFAKHAYPSVRAFIMRDRGFVVLGSDVDDAYATFCAAVKPLLLFDGGGGGGDAESPESDNHPGAKPIGFFRRMFSRRNSADGLGGERSILEAAAATTIRHGGGGGGGGPSSGGGSAGLTPAGSVGAAVVVGSPSSQLATSPGHESDEAMVARMGAAKHRSASDSYTVPTFQTGLKPW